MTRSFGFALVLLIASPLQGCSWAEGTPCVEWSTRPGRQEPGRLSVFMSRPKAELLLGTPTRSARLRYASSKAPREYEEEIVEYVCDQGWERQWHTVAMYQDDSLTGFTMQGIGPFTESRDLFHSTLGRRAQSLSESEYAVPGSVRVLASSDAR